MATARDINPSDLTRQISQSLSFSASPNAAFHSFPSSYGASYSQFASRVPEALPARQLKPFVAEDIKVLLLENVNQTGRDILNVQGYQVEFYKSSLPEDELIEKIRDVHVIGVRSKTKLTARVLAEAKNLIVIGCFCIGTNQVDLQYAADHGIAVFNSPFSNSRSVAELVIAEIISLARHLCDRSMEMHNGMWQKVSNRCWEVRGKTLGIVGYGHIGSQLSVLAESMGMSVIYYDVINLMAMGTARQVGKLEDLLKSADFISLHVPELPETKNMISTAQFEQMKDGSYLINASRGCVVDIPALIQAMRSGKVAGAALDVYPSEPAGNGDYFNKQLNDWAEDLRSLKNLILTPHIGGSTEEAQSAIGIEVGNSLVRYVNEGTTIGAVNMPEVTLRSLTMEGPNNARVIFIHRNIPGVLRKVNEILGNHNVDKQMTDSRGDVAYLMADISDVDSSEIKDLYEQLENLSPRILTRVLF
ncbi:D-3-phosphoglycerate dehydrogenase 2 [Ophidiomyces ophidiicola]|uniref:D-3-phosphoglycerate dehydrogenase 2 n=1 Tax=Ophidiomyces ophidiicola TaxID=1387563 RepID=A0ACB8URS1_9EURO|nr:D-3-phosphoglycerate dehydrogenase 2 [Ophidiomyces ophidiicola]KAI1908212.1 D-3-phosphoglycerate dehydrogenase 2 [Ophidiomyces ophidiicola]KAI1926439.1 D-3-phosphoglycerate dehydrogenase 2 [Ophidiomyces ophidiicola]KAI1931664.1 D-3-phosphoglycerate dehydrogenase 2 [Ophidiomyces ophidiicola]KAI1940232.1 D-3-phosphoglycerate dehydrogenase 2 [Ophidiomyces ophidiicola]KAI1952804.1 D-3-phosphoglycerate dehydrogenase 2 [Ophidiomyces ophidiicola]